MGKRQLGRTEIRVHQGGFDVRCRACGDVLEQSGPDATDENLEGVVALIEGHDCAAGHEQA
jgi:hypothetical protein